LYFYLSVMAGRKAANNANPADPKTATRFSVG
jgi:hypothetical protein